MLDFKIVWKGTDCDFNRYRKGPDGKIYTPEINVIHIMEGTLAGTDLWFNNPEVDASTHYGIGKNGSIHQYVRTEDAAWGNGYVTNPNWYGAKKYPGVNPNLYTISYELEGYTGDVPTDAQWESLIYILKLNNAQYNIVPTKDNHIGHYIIDPKTRANCPGKGFPWEKLYKELKIDAPKVISSMPVLALGAKGDSVIYLQKQLNNKGFNCGISDGDFGHKTLSAVKAFQAANNLVVDGIVGPVTWGLLA